MFGKTSTYSRPWTLISNIFEIICHKWTCLHLSRRHNILGIFNTQYDLFFEENTFPLKGVSHENQEGSKAVSIERSSFKNVSAGSFLYFQSGSFLKSAKNNSETYNRKKLVFFLKLALYIVLFFTARPVHVMRAHAVHARSLHGNVMHGHIMQAMSFMATSSMATSCMPMQCIECFK